MGSDKNQKVNILDIKYDTTQNLVVLKAKSTENGHILEFAMDANDLPFAIGLGKEGVMYPKKVILAIAQTLKGKDVTWQSKLDKSAVLTKKDRKGLSKSLKDNPILDGETEETKKLTEELEDKVTNLNKYPLHKLGKFIKKNIK